jgi:arogenate dehydrogenase (NADP+)
MKVGIVGLGLIGGSLGFDLRSRGFEVLGVSRQAITCEQAIVLGVADRASTNYEVLAPAEIIFICTPISEIAPTIKNLIPYIAPETVITDVGSVKQSIVAECSLLWKNFIGSHPMAGTAQQGIKAAQHDLFIGAPYIITPTSITSKEAIAKVEQIARAIESQVYFCSPADHDRAVAWISHLPVMVSASLISACTQENEIQVLELAKKISSSGFRDTSRVGGGNPELGMMMAKYNSQELLRSLHIYRHNLDNLIAQIEAENWDALEQLLKSTREARKSFTIN